jgi:hypothetical protein
MISHLTLALRLTSRESLRGVNDPIANDDSERGSVTKFDSVRAQGDGRFQLGEPDHVYRPRDPRSTFEDNQGSSSMTAMLS